MNQDSQLFDVNCKSYRLNRQNTLTDRCCLSQFTPAVQLSLQKIRSKLSNTLVFLAMLFAIPSEAVAAVVQDIGPFKLGQPLPQLDKVKEIKPGSHWVKLDKPLNQYLTDIVLVNTNHIGNIHKVTLFGRQRFNRIEDCLKLDYQVFQATLKKNYGIGSIIYAGSHQTWVYQSVSAPAPITPEGSRLMQQQKHQDRREIHLSCEPFQQRFRLQLIYLDFKPPPRDLIKPKQEALPTVDGL